MLTYSEYLGELILLQLILSFFPWAASNMSMTLMRSMPAKINLLYLVKHSLADKMLLQALTKFIQLGYQLRQSILYMYYLRRPPFKSNLFRYISFRFYVIISFINGVNIMVDRTRWKGYWGKVVFFLLYREVGRYGACSGHPSMSQRPRLPAPSKQPSDLQQSIDSARKQ